jgi:hypothetical protein
MQFPSPQEPMKVPAALPAPLNSTIPLVLAPIVTCVCAATAIGRNIASEAIANVTPTRRRIFLDPLED